MLNDFLCQLTGRANRNGNTYVNVENILAAVCYFSIGWIIASIIVNQMIKGRQTNEKLVSLTPTYKAVSYIFGGQDYIVSRNNVIHGSVVKEA